MNITSFLESVNLNAKKTLVFVFGRMNPPTSGHERMLNFAHSIARKEKADFRIYLSHTQDKKKNPLSYEQKLHYVSKGVPHLARFIQKSNMRNAFEIIENDAQGYDRIIYVVGEDRNDEFTAKLTRYPNVEVQHITRGDEEISATKQREAALAGNFEVFYDGCMSGLTTALKADLITDVSAALRLKEEYIPESYHYEDDKCSGIKGRWYVQDGRHEYFLYDVKSLRSYLLNMGVGKEYGIKMFDDLCILYGNKQKEMSISPDQYEKGASNRLRNIHDKYAKEAREVEVAGYKKIKPLENTEPEEYHRKFNLVRDTYFATVKQIYGEYGHLADLLQKLAYQQVDILRKKRYG